LRLLPLLPPPPQPLQPRLSWLARERPLAALLLVLVQPVRLALERLGLALWVQPLFQPLLKLPGLWVLLARLEQALQALVWRLQPLPLPVSEVLEVLLLLSPPRLELHQV
jgi:hypothetical protein